MLVLNTTGRARALSMVTVWHHIYRVPLIRIVEQWITECYQLDKKYEAK